MTQKQLLVSLLKRLGWEEFMDDNFINPEGYAICLGCEEIVDIDHALKRFLPLIRMPDYYRKKLNFNALPESKSFPPLPQKQDMMLTKSRIKKLNKMFKPYLQTDVNKQNEHKD